MTDHQLDIVAGDYSGLVARVAKRASNPKLDSLLSFEDLALEALMHLHLGLVEMACEGIPHGTGFLYWYVEKKTTNHVYTLIGRKYKGKDDPARRVGKQNTDLITEDHFSIPDSGADVAVVNADHGLRLRRIERENPRTRQIFEMKLAGLTDKEIADEYGVVRSMVSRIVRRGKAIYGME